TVGQQVVIAGVTPSLYNGTFIITSATATSFTYTLPLTAVAKATVGSTTVNVTNVADTPTATTITAASTATQAATITAATRAPSAATITAASWSSLGGGTVTITAANTFSVGQAVTIANITGSIVAGGYNGTFTILSATSSSFTFAQAT